MVTNCKVRRHHGVGAEALAHNHCCLHYVHFHLNREGHLHVAQLAYLISLTHPHTHLCCGRNPRLHPWHCTRQRTRALPPPAWHALICAKLGAVLKQQLLCAGSAAAAAAVAHCDLCAHSQMACDAAGGLQRLLTLGWLASCACVRMHIFTLASCALVHASYACVRMRIVTHVCACMCMNT